MRILGTMILIFLAVVAGWLISNALHDGQKLLKMLGWDLKMVRWSVLGLLALGLVACIVLGLLEAHGRLTISASILPFFGGIIGGLILGSTKMGRDR